MNITTFITVTSLFIISFNSIAKDNGVSINQFLNKIMHNPKKVIEQTELLIDDSRTESNLKLRFLQIQAYVANDLDMRLIPKLEELKSLAKELDNQNVLVEVYIYQAMIAKRNEHYSEALQYNYKALKLSKILNSPEVETRALKNIAKLYLELEHYKKAIKHYDDALLLNNKIDNDTTSIIIMEKGLVYLAMGNYYQAKSMLINALRTMRSNDKKAPLLNVYLGQLYVTMGNYTKALTYLESLNQIKINSLPSEVKRNYFEYLAKAYLQKGDFNKAIDIAKIQLSYTYNTRFLLHQTNLQKIIAQSYFQKFDYENAYTFLQRHVLLQQAIHEKLRDSKVLQLEAQFTKEKQESKIKLLEQDSALQRSLYDNQMIAQDKKHQEEQYNQQLWVISIVTSFIGLFFILRQFQVRKYTQKLEENVKERTKELADKNKKLNDLSLLDQLTGLHNRRFLYQSIEKDISRINRYYHQDSFALNNLIEQTQVNLDNREQDLVFILVDLDHFKQVNDKYGHSAGDTVLVQMKALITQTFRESDYFIRWGGEEFLIVTRYVDRNKINIMVERFRAAVASHIFILNENMSIKCTCSIGFAAYPFVQNSPKAFSWEQVIDIADTALYTAKEKQRNAWVGLKSGEQLEKQLDVSSSNKEFEYIEKQKDSYSLSRIKGDTLSMLHENKLKCISSINTANVSELF
jgi:diguanylate cyclase (GGDEF)-like protein